MDKKLLLTIQQECNQQNITLPWKEIGETMGPLISGGAVVQHLSKLRIRMVAQNLSVPPPLKRGGGTKISTAPSLPRRPTKMSSPTTARDSTVKKSGKPMNKKRALADKISDDSEEEDFKTDSDSDADYGKPLAKRTRTAVDSKRQSPTIKSNDTDSSGDSSDNDAEHGEDASGNRVVAAGARFLELEDDVPMQKASPTEVMANKPSKIVTLPLGKEGHTFIKKEPSQEQQSQSDESDESEDEAVEGSEDLANRAAHTLEAISHPATLVTNHVANTSTYPNAGRVSGSGSYAINGNMVMDSKYGHLTANGHSVYGGLPSAATMNGPSFQDAFGGIDYTGGHNGMAEGQPYPSIAQDHGHHMGYGHGYDDLSNQDFSVRGMSMNPAFPGNVFFPGSNDMALSPYVTHSSPSLPRSYPRQGHQASLSAGANSSSSAGPSTVNQTPIKSDADYYFTSSFDQNDHDLGMFTNEDFGNPSYGGYHHGTWDEKSSL